MSENLVWYHYRKERWWPGQVESRPIESLEPFFEGRGQQEQNMYAVRLCQHFRKGDSQATMDIVHLCIDDKYKKGKKWSYPVWEESQVCRKIHHGIPYLLKDKQLLNKVRKYDEAHRAAILDLFHILSEEVAARSVSDDSSDDGYDDDDEDYLMDVPPPPAINGTTSKETYQQDGSSVKDLGKDMSRTITCEMFTPSNMVWFYHRGYWWPGCIISARSKEPISKAVIEGFDERGRYELNLRMIREWIRGEENSTVEIVCLFLCEESKQGKPWCFLVKEDSNVSRNFRLNFSEKLRSRRAASDVPENKLNARDHNAALDLVEEMLVKACARNVQDDSSDEDDDDDEDNYLMDVPPPPVTHGTTSNNHSISLESMARQDTISNSARTNNYLDSGPKQSQQFHTPAVLTLPADVPPPPVIHSTPSNIHSNSIKSTTGNVTVSKLAPTENYVDSGPKKSHHRVSFSPQLDNESMSIESSSMDMETPSAATLTESALSQTSDRKDSKQYHTPAARILEQARHAVSSAEQLISGNNGNLIPMPDNVKLVYGIVQKLTGTLGGNSFQGPIYGELTIYSMHVVFSYMGFYTGFCEDSSFLDIGSGIGKPVIHAAQFPGVAVSCGIELHPVRWLLSICCLHEVLKVADEQKPDTASAVRIGHRCYFVQGDISNVKTFNPFTHIYTFSIGFTPELLLLLSEIWNRSSSPFLICYHGPKDIIECYGFRVKLVTSVPRLRMHGSGEVHMGYIYQRLPAAPLEDQAFGGSDPAFSSAWDLTRSGLKSLRASVSETVRTQVHSGSGAVTRSKEKLMLIKRMSQLNSSSTRASHQVEDLVLDEQDRALPYVRPISKGSEYSSPMPSEVQARDPAAIARVSRSTNGDKTASPPKKESTAVATFSDSVRSSKLDGGYEDVGNGRERAVDNSGEAESAFANQENCKKGSLTSSNGGHTENITDATNKASACVNEPSSMLENCAASCNPCSLDESSRIDQGVAPDDGDDGYAYQMAAGDRDGGYEEYHHTVVSHTESDLQAGPSFTSQSGTAADRKDTRANCQKCNQRCRCVPVELEDAKEVTGVAHVSSKAHLKKAVETGEAPATQLEVYFACDPPVDTMEYKGDANRRPSRKRTSLGSHHANDATNIGNFSVLSTSAAEKSGWKSDSSCNTGCSTKGSTARASRTAKKARVSIFSDRAHSNTGIVPNAQYATVDTQLVPTLPSAGLSCKPTSPLASFETEKRLSLSPLRSVYETPLPDKKRTYKEKLDACLEALNQIKENGHHPLDILGNSALEKNVKRVVGFLEAAVESEGSNGGDEGDPAAVYVCGGTGVGKTSVVMRCCRQVTREWQTDDPDCSNPITQYVNVRHLLAGGGRAKTSNIVQNKLCEGLGISIKSKNWNKAHLKIKAHLKKRKLVLILVLDEVDGLIQDTPWSAQSGPETELQTIINCANDNTFPLALIGISNVTCHTKYMRLQNLGQFQSDLLFNRYSKEELIHILQARVGVSTVAEPVLEFAALKVARTSGDARMAFELVFEAVKRCKDSMPESMVLCDAKSEPFVDMKHLRPFLQEKIKEVLNSVAAMPQAHKLILSVAVALAEENIIRTTIAHLKQFSLSCIKAQGYQLEGEEFILVLSTLHDQGLLFLGGDTSLASQSLSEIASRSITLGVQPGDLVEVVKDQLDHPMFQQLREHVRKHRNALQYGVDLN